MSSQTAHSVDLGRILERGNLHCFFEETARFYESRLTVLDEALGTISDLNGGCDPESVSGKAAELDSSRVNAVEVYGSTVGYVAAEPVSGRNRPAAEALSRYAADLLSELAVKEYELNDLSQEILDSYEEVNLFYDVAAALGAVRDVAGVCTVILRKACEIIKVNRASILLLDEKAEELSISAAMGIPDDEVASVRIPVGVGISGKVLASRTPQLVDDVRNLPEGMLKGYEQYATRSFISVPLFLGGDGGVRPSQDGVLEFNDRTWLSEREGRAIGVINMTDKQSGENFTSGDLKLLTALANQAAVLIENIRLIELEKELRIARNIQQSLLPDAPPKVPGLEIAGACLPARNVGGDYYDFLQTEDDGRLATAIADVSGHNMASALMMAVVRSALRGELRRFGKPGDVLGHLNDFLYEDLTRAELFLSLFCCIYDPETATLEFANAGHNPTLLFRESDGGCRLLDADGLLAGIMEDVEYPTEEIRLEPGDVILLYTDGIVETMDSAGIMFGLDRLATVLTRSRLLPARDLLDGIFDEVSAFSGEASQKDDMTAVVLKVTDPPCR